MIIRLNGQNTTISAAPDLYSVLDATGYAGKIIAVACNGTFVPKSAYADTHLKDGDELEIVAPMQGG